MHGSFRRTRRRVLAATSAAAVLATTALGVAPAMAHSQAPTTTPVNITTQKNVKAIDKFTPKAKAELTKEKSADFWVKMTDKADLTKAKTIKNWDERGQYVADTLKAQAKASQKDALAALDKRDIDHQSYWLSNRILVKGGTMNLASSLAKDPKVKEIHESVVVDKPDPVVEKKSKQAPKSSKKNVEWGVAETGAPEAWDQGITGSGIVVSSVDTGTQYDHPALVEKYRGNNGDGTFTNDYNWFDTAGVCDGAPCDDPIQNVSHGTHTMGTMVGSDDEDNQIGMAPDAQWVEANGCATCQDADLLAAGQWIVEPTDLEGENPDVSKRPHIVNNSWGSSIPGDIDDWFQDLTDAWEAAGIFGVWAAGNDGPQCKTTSSPGANTSNYSVGNYKDDGAISPLSSRGEGEDGKIKPNIAAPGTDIRSSIADGGYGLLSGTSMAAPHVAGAVALLWSHSPALVGDIQGTRDLLNETAIDTDDTSCGGTKENNNVFGEGKLDVVALLDAAPADAVGTLTGSIKNVDGTGLAGAEVKAVNGDFTRTVTADEDGVYTLQAPKGKTKVTVSAFAYDSKTKNVEIVEDESTTLNYTLKRAFRHTVTGTVTDDEKQPLAGVSVDIADQLETATTDKDGKYSIAKVPAGKQTVTATSGICYSDAEEKVTVDGDTEVDLTMDLVRDEWGYSCAETSEDYLKGETALDLSGDDVSAAVELPFEFPLYGEDYSEANVSTNGFVSFLDASSEYSNTQIPDTAPPNAALYPFWDDLNVDTDAAVYTKATEVDGQDAFIIEWRHVKLGFGSDARVSFSATLLADGGVKYGYADVEDSDDAAGASATVGLENEAGTVGYQYSFNDAFAEDKLSVSFKAPASATLKGVVTDKNTEDPIEGATVTITDADENETEAKTGEDGKYSKTLVLGEYSYTIEAKGYTTAKGTFELKEDGGEVTESAELKAGRLEVNKEEISANVDMGDSKTRKVKVTNTGSAPAEVKASAGGDAYEILGSAGSAKGVINHVHGDATVPKSSAGNKSGISADKSKGDAKGKKALGTAGGKSSKSGDFGKNKRPVTPEAPPVKADETVLSHSTSQDIAPVNSAACNGGPTQVLRTFTLEDFDITSDFDVSEVQFGVENNLQAQDVTVNLYTLDGDLAYANMEQIGTATTNLEAQEATMVSVPVEGTVPAGGTLVAEISNEIGASFYVGSNAEEETAPSYIASEFCDIPEPTPTAEIDFPDMHVVMNVVGETAGGANLDWMDIQPSEFTLAPGKSMTVTATLDASGVDQPGTFTADLIAAATTPYEKPVVKTTMNVKAPAGWGKITGVVSGAGKPLEDAVVHLGGLSYDVTLRTDADGKYAYWMQKSNAPLTVTVSATDFIPQTKKAQIISGQTSVYNFDLKEFE